MFQLRQRMMLLVVLGCLSSVSPSFAAEKSSQADNGLQGVTNQYTNDMKAGLAPAAAVTQQITQTPKKAKQVVFVAVSVSPESAAEIVVAAIETGEISAEDAVKAAISADKAVAGDVVAAVLAIPGVDTMAVVNAAVQAAPDASQDIITAAVVSNPEMVEEIVVGVAEQVISISESDPTFSGDAMSLALNNVSQDAESTEEPSFAANNAPDNFGTSVAASRANPNSSFDRTTLPPESGGTASPN